MRENSIIRYLCEGRSIQLFFFSRYFILTAISIINITYVLSAIINAFYQMYVVDNWDVTTYFKPHKLLIPFNDGSTIQGYILEMLFGAFAGYTYSCIMCSTVAFFVSCSFYIQACCQHLREIFRNINEIVVNDSMSEPMDLKCHFINAIKLHMQIIKWVRKIRFVSAAEIYFRLSPNRIFEIVSKIVSGTIFIPLTYFAGAIFQTEKVLFFYFVSNQWCGTAFNANFRQSPKWTYHLFTIWCVWLSDYQAHFSCAFSRQGSPLQCRKLIKSHTIPTGYCFHNTSGNMLWWCCDDSSPARIVFHGIRSVAMGSKNI